MRILFVHLSFPGQYLHLAPHLAALGHEVVALREATKLEVTLSGVRQITYATPREPAETLAFEERVTLMSSRRGASVAARVDEFARSGFRPDLICSHVAAGLALFLKDVVPSAKLLAYCEFLRRPRGNDGDFDMEFTPSKALPFWLRVVNGPDLSCLALSDGAVSATYWQRSQFPRQFSEHIEVIHDGINTDAISAGEVHDEELVTFAARSLEPHRGFHMFMRAIPEIQRRRPKARIVIVGADEPSYSSTLKSGLSYREHMLQELDGKIDLSRVHFLGQIPFHEHLALMRRSTVHVYLTYPFVLSWSVLEAMATGCLVVGSRTPPVVEVIEDGVNGILVDFFSPDEIAAKVAYVIQRRGELRPLREAARRTVLERYDLKRVCLPAQVKLVERISGRK